MDEKKEIDWNERWLSIEERLDFMAGRIHALRSFAFAVITVAPQIDTLGKALDKSLESALARATPEPVGEDYLNGLHEEMQALRACVDISREHPAKPPAP